MSTFPGENWGTILPPLDATDPGSVRAFQARAVGWGNRVGYTTEQQRDLLEQLGLLAYVSKPGTGR